MANCQPSKASVNEETVTEQGYFFFLVGIHRLFNTSLTLYYKKTTPGNICLKLKPAPEEGLR